MRRRIILDIVIGYLIGVVALAAVNALITAATGEEFSASGAVAVVIAVFFAADAYAKRHKEELPKRGRWTIDLLGTGAILALQILWIPVFLMISEQGRAFMAPQDLSSLMGFFMIGLVIITPIYLFILRFLLPVIVKARVKELQKKASKG